MFLSKFIRTTNVKNVIRRFSSNSTTIGNLDINRHDDPTQQQALTDKLYLVDDEDKVIGIASKKDCHLVQENGDIPLHRAFSFFLFNSRGDLLLQKRSSSKLTYPDYYTNTCCSHPLANVEGEDDEINQMGIKRAAQRRLNYELGIPKDQLPLEEMKYLGRIHYKDAGNGQWGEHEIDYILIMKKDVKIQPNSNEVSAISYVPRGEINHFLAELDEPLTPWFSLILKHRLKIWWDNLNNLDKHVEKKILVLPPPANPLV